MNDELTVRHYYGVGRAPYALVVNHLRQQALTLSFTVAKITKFY